MKSKTKLTKEQKDVLNALVSIVPTNLEFVNNTEKEVFALIYYMDSKHDGEQFTCGYKEFEDSCGLHRNTVSRYIELLKCKGYINYKAGHKNHNSDFVCCIDKNGNIMHKNIVHNEVLDNEDFTPNIVHNNYATLCTNNNNKDNNNSKDKVNMNSYVSIELFNSLVNKVEGLVNEVNSLKSTVELLTIKNNNSKTRIDKLVESYKKSCDVIKSLTNQQPTNIETNKINVNTSTGKGGKHFDEINNNIKTIKSTNSTEQEKLESSQNLQKLINSGELSKKQIEMCEKWVKNQQQHQEPKETIETVKEKIDLQTYWNKLQSDKSTYQEKVNAALELKRFSDDGKLTPAQIEVNKKNISKVLTDDDFKLPSFVEMCKKAKTNSQSCSLEELLTIVELRYQLNNIQHHTKNCELAILINETLPKFRKLVIYGIVPYLKETFESNNMAAELERLEKAMNRQQTRNNNINDTEQINTKTDDEVQLPNGTYEENINHFTERYIEYMKREAKGEPINVDDKIKKKYVETCRRLNKYEHSKESVITEYWLVADKEFRQYNISNSKIKRIA